MKTTHTQDENKQSKSEEKLLLSSINSPLVATSFNQVNSLTGEKGQKLWEMQTISLIQMQWHISYSQSFSSAMSRGKI